MVRDTPSQQQSVGWAGGRLSFAFEHAPISVVAEAVLGQGLGASYTIDPEVTGNITLRTARALGPEDVVAALDRALWLQGAALIQNLDGTFTITTAARATSLSPPPRLSAARTRGGGVVIVPLQFVSAENMASVLEGFGRNTSVVRVDGERQILILQGDERSLDVLLETIDMFDVDWMAAAEFRFYGLQWVAPEELASEITALMGGADGMIGRQVEFVPITRLNGLVVITRRPERQETIGQWIEQLDRPASGGTGRRVRQITLLYQDAETVAATLQNLFGGEMGTRASPVQSNSTVRQPTASARPQPGSASPQQGQEASPNAVLASVPQQAGQTAQEEQERPGPQSQSGSRDQQSSPRVTADAATNSILVYASDEEYRQLEDVIERLDVAPDQVLIEATIIEVVLNDQLRYGVQWFFDPGDGRTITLSSTGNNQAASILPGFSYRFVGSDTRAVVNALSDVTDVSVLSSPQIMTLDNRTASLQVGDQVPVLRQSAQGTTSSDPIVLNSIDYRDTGIVLSVTPRVGAGDQVLINITLEVSEVAAASSSGINSPTIQQRRFQTEVAVSDGETIALGGLIRTRESEGRSGVPVLSNVPVLGGLFGSSDRSQRRTELVIFLAPRIVRTPEDARAASDEVRRRFQFIGPLSGR